MADDILLFDVEPRGESKAFLVFDKVATALGKIIESGKVAKSVMDGFRDVAKIVAPDTGTGKAGGAIGGIGQVLFSAAKDKAGGAIGGIGQVLFSAAKGLIKLGEAVLGVTRTFQKVGDEFDQFVRYLSPATSQRFQYAMEDLYATIGEKLLPIFEPFITLIEKFADALAGITTGGLFSALGELLSKVGGAFISIFKALTPIINAVIWVFEKLVDVVNWFVDNIGKRAGNWALDAGLRAGGVDPNRAGGAAESEGGRARATRGISVAGLESISQRALEAAGNIGQSSAADRTADATTNIWALLNRAVPGFAQAAADGARAGAMDAARRDG